MSLVPLCCMVTNPSCWFVQAVAFLPSHLCSECLLATHLTTPGFCFSSAFSRPIGSEKSGKSVNVASRFTEGHKVKKLNKRKCILNVRFSSLTEPRVELNNNAPPRSLGTALSMPEPFTAVGPKLQPITLFTVKWTLLTLVWKHSTKFNDCAYKQSSKASPCQQPSSLPVSILIVNLLKDKNVFLHCYRPFANTNTVVPQYLKWTKQKQRST